MIRPGLPPVVLLDLDDTILDDSSQVSECWREACLDHRPGLGDLDPEALHDTIERVRDAYWSDPERHRLGRLDLDRARCDVVRMSLAEMGVEDSNLAWSITHAYVSRRDRGLQPLPGALETVRWFRESGSRLALLTNGTGPAQRRKIERFALADWFERILIEGELGFGKPDPRVFRRALDEMGVEPGDAWMIGDNLEWDVAAPQRMGIFAIWIDTRGRGAPDNGVRPDRIIRGLSELRELNLGPRPGKRT